MNLRSSRVLLACAVLLSASAPASAPAQRQPTGNKKKAIALFEKGEVQYKLGHWQQAIDLWDQAYQTFDAPEFLFNIGQAHRKADNCEQALFFYRRYLDDRPNAPNRAEVEGFIKDMEERCKDRPGGAPSPPNGGGKGDESTGPRSEMGPPSDRGAGPEAGGPPMADARGRTGAQGDQGNGDVRGNADQSGEPDQTVAGEVAAARPRLFAIRAAAGASYPTFGSRDLNLDKPFTAVALGVGHPIYVGSVVLEPGALVTYTPVPWDGVNNEGDPVDGTAGFIGILADLGLSYEFIPGLSGRLDVGIGTLLVSGLAEGSPFTNEREDVEGGALPLFAARVALGGEYAITDNFLIHAQPLVFSYSPSAPLHEEIDKITRFEILVGAGFRM